MPPHLMPPHPGSRSAAQPARARGSTATTAGGLAASPAVRTVEGRGRHTTPKRGKGHAAQLAGATGSPRKGSSERLPQMRGRPESPAVHASDPAPPLPPLPGALSSTRSNLRQLPARLRGGRKGSPRVGEGSQAQAWLVALSWPGLSLARDGLSACRAQGDRLGPVRQLLVVRGLLGEPAAVVGR